MPLTLKDFDQLDLTIGDIDKLGLKPSDLQNWDTKDLVYAACTKLERYIAVYDCVVANQLHDATIQYKTLCQNNKTNLHDRAIEFLSVFGTIITCISFLFAVMTAQNNNEVFELRRETQAIQQQIYEMQRSNTANIDRLMQQVDLLVQRAAQAEEINTNGNTFLDE